MVASLRRRACGTAADSELRRLYARRPCRAALLRPVLPDSVAFYK
jgi:hypothetical protein